MIINPVVSGVQLPELTTPAGSGQILSGYQAINEDGEGLTGSIPSQGAQTITPGTNNKTIAAGRYLSGVQTIAGDADLVAGNIRSGANIFGVAGSVQATGSASVNIIYNIASYDKIIFFDSDRQLYVRNMGEETNIAVTVITPSILILFYSYEPYGLYTQPNSYSGIQPSDSIEDGSPWDRIYRSDIFVINGATTISVTKNQV